LFYGLCQRQEASASLHYTSGATLCFATFRYIPFIVSPSLGNPRKSASIHSIALMPTRRFIPLPFGFPATSRNSKPKLEAPFHPTQFATFHSVITLAFPHANHRYALRRVCPGKQKPQTPHRPLMVQVKIKDHSRIPLCLQPFRLTHSTVRFDARSSRRRSLFHFVHLTSFSTPRVSVSFLNTHTFPIPQQERFSLFLPAILFAP
jgi:hypothetical protein